MLVILLHYVCGAIGYGETLQVISDLINEETHLSLKADLLEYICRRTNAQ